MIITLEKCCAEYNNTHFVNSALNLLTIYGITWVEQDDRILRGSILSRLNASIIPDSQSNFVISYGRNSTFQGSSLQSRSRR